DDNSLYVGVACTQTHFPVLARLTRRDRQVPSDRIEIDIGSQHDGKSAFHFEVNAAGVQVDGIRYNDTELLLDWDGNWQAATATSAQGWSAEIRLPLRVLRFAPAAEQTWSLQVRRQLAARQEIDEWAYIARSEAGEVSHYGEVGP